MASKEVFADASKWTRSYEVAGGDQDEDVIRKSFDAPTPANAGRAPAQVHFPSNSGATIGFGHDLGQSSAAEIDSFYGPVGDMGPQREILTSDQRDVLKTFVGKKVMKEGKGSAAFTATKDIRLTYEQATEVFEQHILPRKAIKYADEIPGFEELPRQQQVAIIDRIYMRGKGVGAGEDRVKAGRMVTQLHKAVFEKNTAMVHATLVEMEGLHRNDSRPSSTQGRARARSALALQGMETIDPHAYTNPIVNYQWPSTGPVAPVK